MDHQARLPNSSASMLMIAESTKFETTGVPYWVNWRVLLCSMWVLMSIVFASTLVLRHECRHDHDHDHDDKCPGFLYDDEVWKPCITGMHPGWLLGFRAFAFAVLIPMLLINAVVDGGSIFYFYTQWTFTLVTIYFGLGSLVSIRGCYIYRDHNRDDHLDTERGFYIYIKVINQGRRKKAGFLAYLLQIIFQMSGGAAVLTDAVFWLIMVPFLSTKDYHLNFLRITMHSMNVIFLVGDTALNSLRFPWFRVGYFLLWTCTYIIFQWILHACVSIWWPYPFLDLSSSYAPLLYSTLALMHAPCYGIFALMVKVKQLLAPKVFPGCQVVIP